MAHMISRTKSGAHLDRRMGNTFQELGRVFQAVLLTTMIAGVLACSGPLANFPGGQLSGQLAEPGTVPADWSAVGEYGFFELETRPSDPYSVNIAYTVVGGALYAYAGATETQWVKNMKNNPLVIVGLDGTLYPLRATRVTLPSEIQEFGTAWTSQNSFHRDPKDSEEVWLYRLSRR
jgi:hypothetical protein